MPLAAIPAVDGAIPAFAVLAHLDPEIHRIFSVELEDRSSPVGAHVVLERQRVAPPLAAAGLRGGTSEVVEPVQRVGLLLRVPSDDAVTADAGLPPFDAFLVIGEKEETVCALVKVESALRLFAARLPCSRRTKRLLSRPLSGELFELPMWITRLR